jgi:molybdenum cofactor cytidylyltransferase
MGTSKQLLRLGNKAVIRHCVDTLVVAGIKDIVVVCGAGYDACARELEGTGACIVRNEAKVSEMADSVRIGLQTLDDEIPCSGVIVALCDHPLVSEETCRTIVKFHLEMPDKIIIPAFKGRRGHPSLFPAEVISDIFFVPSLRDLIRSEGERVLVVDVPDEGIVMDMDTEEDYRMVAARYAILTNSGQAGESDVH